MRKLLFLGVALLVLFGCRGTKSIVSTNKANIYRYHSTNIHPQFIVYHANDTISTVYFKIKTKELLYTKKEYGNIFMAKVKISYKVLKSYESKIVLDSAILFVADTGNIAKQREIIGNFNIKVDAGNNYVLDILVSDMYRNSSILSYVPIEKTSTLTKQNFLMYDKNGNIQFSYLYNNKPIYIKFNDPSIKELILKYYDRNFPIAAPPFSVVTAKPFDFKPDDVSYIQRKNGEFIFKPENYGMYLLQADTIQRTGLTIMNLNSNFPNVSTPEELIAPLRFITTRKEYESLINSETQKLALDSFWLRLGSNYNHSRSMIKNYYVRVQDANMFFTSYQEGWKTDRGMIYTVFGPPNVIYRSSYSESWLYGEENNFNSLNFNFTKVKNPFSDNDYSLNRSSIYKGNFYKAVDTWRQGRVTDN